MLECRPPSACLSAGAITSANRIGVMTGTAIWRGLCAGSARRRDASVRSERPSAVGRGDAARATAAGWGIVVAIGVRFTSRGLGRARVGEAQVDVVERRLPGPDLACRQARAVEG